MSIFNTVKIRNPRSNVFDLSHEHKLTTDMARLTPIFACDALPADRFRLNTEIFMRFEPMLSPVMHRVNVYTHFYFVPMRLIERDWEDFITGGENGNYQGQRTKICFRWAGNSDWTISTEEQYEIFKLVLGVGSLSDYLGIKVAQEDIDSSSWPFLNVTTVNAEIYLAYALIWNEYYRDQNLQQPLPVQEFLDKYGGQTVNFEDIWNDDDVIPGTDKKYRDIFMLRNRCWEKDYFTSALPWPQRGDQMTLPISGMADVVFNSNGATYVKNSSDSPIPANSGLATGSLLPPAYAGGLSDSSRLSFGPYNETNYVAYALLDNSSNLKADLTGATAVTVNELRRVMAIQRWMEANARGGSRYVEQLLMHFGLSPRDARLQRPEYLGGGKSPVIISEVLQQSQSTENSPQGNMAGRAVSTQASHSFKYNVNEHGWIIGIMSVMPRTSYMQGLPRKYTRSDKFDYAWPELAHLGEQEILQRELYNGPQADSEELTGGAQLFGYTPRYAEYKFMPDSVSGQFRSSYAFWHLGRKLSNPALNDKFVEANPSTRIFAVETANGDSVDHLLCDIYFNFKGIRPLPKYGTPI